jgi:tryptophan synthase alpha chain
MSASPIRLAIERGKREHGIALMPFLAAGFPDLDTTTQCIRSLDKAGASLIEIGFPFSDPIADGPTIQEAFTAALSRGIRVSDVLEMSRQVAPTVATPLVAMLSFSIVFRYGVERFVRDAKGAGFAGLIIPDLPPPDAERVCDLVRAGGLDTILLVAPSTAAARRARIVQLSSGFVYYLSVAGVTGARDRLPDDLPTNVRQIKGLSDVPVCVGFGIHLPEHVGQLRGIADGAIVGSAFVRRAKAQNDAGAVADDAARFAQTLLGTGRPMS